jgi:hypothetical protein
VRADGNALGMDTRIEQTDCDGARRQATFWASDLANTGLFMEDPRGRAEPHGTSGCTHKALVSGKLGDGPDVMRVG